MLRGDGLCMSREQSGDGCTQPQASKQQQASGQKRGMPGSALHQVRYAYPRNTLAAGCAYCIVCIVYSTNTSCVRCA